MAAGGSTTPARGASTAAGAPDGRRPAKRRRPALADGDGGGEDTDPRSQIIAAAKACFADHGYNNTTNKMIASAAGVVPGLIYYYFDSKEQLFISVFEHMYQRRDERLADFDFTEHSLRENLARMLDDSMHLALDDSSFVEVFELSGREVSRNPALAEAWEAHWQRVVHVWSRIVDAAVQRGEVAPSHRDGLVDVLVAWFGGFLTWVSRQQPAGARISATSEEFLRMVDTYVAHELT
jgi:AcrR family transcriptional regulator